ncbi:hypothetical protein XU18_1296 [Perkinsela sp. CCAP 1560/4]|nr:hypothetical protein XU18_1296 [Perkinsela sp. CCAP 1560/4]|eukprot:KNH08130.1 hypothetical protein XU18_1296 [Perkinsela sp. CCAP 1560/4]
MGFPNDERIDLLPQRSPHDQKAGMRSHQGSQSNLPKVGEPQAASHPQPDPAMSSIYAVEPPATTPAEAVSLPPSLDSTLCRPSRIVAITVPPRGSFGNLTDANEDEFHFVNHFYESIQRLGEVERVLCYRECLPNGTTKNRMIVAFDELEQAVECVRSLDRRPFMGTKRVTRCQFVPLQLYDRLKTLKPE